ncbi:MAG: hypothetical protein WAX07_07360 [Candidatus Altiarchaeia archaeon]
MARKNALIHLLDGELPNMGRLIAASKWYGANEDAIRRKYGGRFIAVRGEVVKSSKSSGDLIGKLGDSTEWFITFVQKEKTIACW